MTSKPVYLCQCPDCDMRVYRAKSQMREPCPLCGHYPVKRIGVHPAKQRGNAITKSRRRVVPTRSGKVLLQDTPVPPRACVLCDKEFVPVKRNAELCSPACRNALRLISLTEWTADARAKRAAKNK